MNTHEALEKFVANVGKKVIRECLPNPAVIEGLDLDVPLQSGATKVVKEITKHVDPMVAGALLLGGYLLYQHNKMQQVAMAAAMANQQTQYKPGAMPGPGVQPDSAVGVDGEEVRDGKPKIAYTYTQGNQKARRGR